MMEMNIDPRLNNVQDLLDSLSSGSAITYLNGVVEKINAAKEGAKTLQNAIVRNKKITEYEYYTEINDEFSKIYNGIGKHEVLPSFGFSNEEINNLENIKEKPMNQRKEELDVVLNKMGIDPTRIDFTDPQNITAEIIGQIGTQIVSNKTLLGNVTDGIYFKEVTDLIKTIEEYATALVDLNALSASQPLTRLIAKTLYEKAYENNKKIIVDAYQTATHEKVDFNKVEDNQKMSEYMRKEHKILMECMINRIRVDVAHSKYGNVDDYTSEQLLEMSTRNLITSIIGIVVKTNNIAETFEKQVKTVSTFMNLPPGTQIFQEKGK